MLHPVSIPIRKIGFSLGLLTAALAASCASHHHHHHKPQTAPASVDASPVVTSTQPADTAPALPSPKEPTVPATGPTTQPASEPAPATAAPESAPSPQASTQPTTAASTEPATQPTSEPTAGARSLFNGKDLAGWTITDFAGHAEPKVEDESLVLPAGETLTGVNLKEETPKVNYDVDLDAQRVMGSDFFCGLTVPVKDSNISLIIGGWGGGVCGISSIDQNDAARNDTTTVHKFAKGKWYHIRLRVTADRLQAWIDDDEIVDTTTKGHVLSVRAEVEPSRPFGICSYQTTAAIRHVMFRPLTDKEIEEAASEK